MCEHGWRKEDNFGGLVLSLFVGSKGLSTTYLYGLSCLTSLSMNSLRTDSQPPPLFTSFQS